MVLIRMMKWHVIKPIYTFNADILAGGMYYLNKISLIFVSQDSKLYIHIIYLTVLIS